MTAAIDDDYLDYDEDPSATRFVQPRSSGAEDKANEGKLRAQRMAAAQMWHRKCHLLVCGMVVVSVASLLTFTTYKILMSPDQDLALTPAVRITRRPQFSKADANNTLLPHSLEELGDDDVAHRGLLEEAMNAPSEGSYYFCDTEACKSMAAYLEGLLSVQRNSCASLYDQVCTRWSRSHLQLAESRGRHYAVDDNVIDDVLVEVGRLHLEPEAPFLNLAAFFSACVDGLLIEERDLESLLDGLVTLSVDLTPSSLADVVVRMARLDVSPFFDVHVDSVNGTFSARLVSPEAVTLTGFLRKDGDRVARPRTGKGAPSAITTKRNSRNATEFFRILERELCTAIVAIANVSVPCTVAVDSSLSSERDYDWYATKGPVYLTTGVASMLEDLSAYRKELEDKINTFSSFRITASSRQERVIRCLRFIDQHDHDLFPRLVTTRVSPRLGADVSDFLGQFKAHLDKKIPNASTISVTFPTASLRDNGTILYLHSEYLYGNDPASNVSRLRSFLERSAWKRWTDGFSSRTPSMSSAARFLRSSSVLEVPLGLFNLTMLRDRWLRDLSLARVGPRVLEALFFGALSRDIRTTNFFQCVSTRAAASGRVVRGRRFADAMAPFSIPDEREELQLDIEELAAFYLSLQAYRARVGDAVAIPGSLLNSDSLFLLYYVYNNCLAVSNGKAEDDPKGGGGYGVNRAPSFDSRRRRVDSVAAMFGGLLPEACLTIPDLSACEVEGEDIF